MRSRRVLAGLFLVLLLAVPSASALRVTGGHTLGKVDAGSTHDLPVLLDNQDGTVTVAGSFGAAANVAQAATAADLAAVPSWLTGEASTWAVAAQENDTFGMTLHVPATAHAGPYLLLGEFLETQNMAPTSGAVVGVRINHAVGVSFVVRGVDLVGRIAVPPVVKPEAHMAQISLAVGNWLDGPVTGRPVQEIWHEEELVRVVHFDPRTIQPSPQGPLASFAYRPDFRGLPEGDYLVRTYAEYRVGPGGAALTSLPRDQPLVIGEEVLAYTGHALTTPGGTFPAPDGSTLELPKGIDATLQLHVANLRPLQALADLVLEVTGPDGAKQSISRNVPVPPNAIHEATLPFRLEGPGTYKLELREEGNLTWTQTLDVEVPVVAVEDVGFHRGRFTFTVRNDGVLVEACHAADVLTAFGQAIPGRAPTQDCRRLARGESWRVEAPVDTVGLPDGQYLADLRVSWTGADQPFEHQVAFEFPFESPLERIVEFATEPNRIAWTLGIAFAIIAAIIAGIVVWRARRSRAPQPQPVAPPALPAWAQAPTLPPVQPVYASARPMAAPLMAVAAGPGMVATYAGSVPPPPNALPAGLPRPSTLPADLDALVRALEEAAANLPDDGALPDHAADPAHEPAAETPTT